MKFAVGQKWRTRGGDVVEITEIVTNPEVGYPIYGHINGITMTWTDDGKYRSWAKSHFDLIELIEPATNTREINTEYAENDIRRYVTPEFAKTFRPPQNERETMSDRVAENRRQADVMYAAEYEEGVGVRCTNIELTPKGLPEPIPYSATSDPQWNWIGYDYRVVESVVTYANVYAGGILGGQHATVPEAKIAANTGFTAQLIDRLKLTITNGKASVELIGLE